MIHKKGITCKLIQLKNVTDSFLYDQAVRNIELDRCACPCCSERGQFQKITPYRRSMICVSNGRREEISVSVQRVLCRSCGHTQAILPDILIPSGSYSIRFILTVLTEYYLRSCTVAELCDKWFIAVSTLYAWLRLFKKHISEWHSSLGLMVQAYKDILQHIFSIASFPFLFWRSTGSFFFHNSSVHYHYPYIT